VDPSDSARTNAIGRAVLGAALIAVPGVAARSWIGDAASAPGAKVLARALGVRDVALGSGLLWALAREEPVHPWLTGAAVADTVDAAATLLAWDSLPRAGRWLVLAVAAGSAIQMGILAADSAS
jgi:hypothetical protein